MSTKRIIADQTLYRLYGGLPDSAAPVQKYDIFKALEQKINGLFKLHQFDATLPTGGTIPEHAMIATYENVAVTSVKEWAESILPIEPISMPLNMGIFLIYNPAYPNRPFIPLQRGQRALLSVDTLLNDLQGMVGYEPKSNKVIYTRDITTIGITSVTMELCVFDIAQYSETQVLPIPADYEERIVNELVQMFSPVQPETGIVNPITTLSQQPVK